MHNYADKASRVPSYQTPKRQPSRKQPFGISIRMTANLLRELDYLCRVYRIKNRNTMMRELIARESRRWRSINRALSDSQVDKMIDFNRKARMAVLEGNKKDPYSPYSKPGQRYHGDNNE